jgi:hypothetical protein
MQHGALEAVFHFLGSREPNGNRLLRAQAAIRAVLTFYITYFSNFQCTPDSLFWVEPQSPASENYSQPRSEVQIAQWRSLCRNAAEGDGSARSGIGSHYRQGWEPVQQNLVRAFQWFSLAADAGHDDAARYRDEVAAQMSPEQLAEARQLIAEWVPDAAICEAEGLSSPMIHE